MRIGLLVLVLLGGCVSTQPATLDTPEGRARVNERAAGRAAMLHLDGEPARAVRSLRVDAGEATWTDRRTGDAGSAPTARVRAVTFGAGRRSVLRGVAVGAATGLALGTVAALADRDCREWICFGPEIYLAVGLANGVVLGSALSAAQWTRFDTRPVGP